MSEQEQENQNVDQAIGVSIGDNECDSNMMYINGVISPESITPIMAKIAMTNLKNDHNCLILFINSGGGDLFEGLSLASFIKASRIPIITVAIGRCDSSALMIAISGHFRFVSPTCSLLSHQYSASIPLTKYDDMVSRQKDLKNIADNVINHYMDCTELSETEIKKKLLKNTDVFLTPKEAIGLKMFDAIFDDFNELLSFNNLNFEENENENEDEQKNN